MTPRSRRIIWLSIAALFCLCVAFKLNGSSVGVWSEILYESGKPRGLLFSTPKYVRADEWHGWTPAALSQARQSPRFPIQNLSLGGERAPLIMSVPVTHYTMLFRPQFWGFFVLDFERGFSFLWCAKIFALLLVSRWFFRRLGVSEGFAWFGALWIFFSAYVQWWFSSPTMLPEMLATWMVCVVCGVQLFVRHNRWQVLAAFGGFVVCGINFVLCLYPPYQIPLLWLMLAIWIGILLERRRGEDPVLLQPGLLLVAGAILLTLALLIPYWLDARSTLDLVAHTAYPGSRRSTGGDLSIFKLFSGVVGFFETEKIFPRAYDNVCEASNFYPLWPAALLGVAVARWKGASRIPASIAALSIAIVVFSFYCVVPLPTWLLQISGLGLTTERRTLLAIGIATTILCTIFLDRYRQPLFSKGRAITLGAAFWIGVALLCWIAGSNKTDFFPSKWQIATALAANAVIFIFFLESARRWFAIGFVALLIASNAFINPMMRGLSPLLEAGAFQAIDTLRSSEPSAKWLVYHDDVLGQLVIATGAPTFTGNKVVPDFTFLRQLDPSGEAAEAYNRYAYVRCELPTETEKPGARLIQHDLYSLYLPPQAPLLRELNCRYFLFPEPWPDAGPAGCPLAGEIPQSKIYIYHSN